MERTFERSICRRIQSLEGQWSITFDPDNQGLRKGYPQGKNLGNQKTWIPSCWNFETDKYDYMGPVWFSREFVTDRKANTRLVFHAVSGTAVVYLDGKKIGSHYGSYNKFWYDIRDLRAGNHLLVVKVDNTVNEKDTLPLTFVDWLVYGGIYRGVDLEQYDQLSIESIKIDTQWISLDVRKILVQIQVKNWSRKTVRTPLKLRIENQYETDRNLVADPSRISSVVFEISDFKPKLWDLTRPHLYRFHVSCGEDDLFERTGFRKIERKKKKIYLNGKCLFIKGINRHNDHPDLGYAINPALIRRDIKIIKELGCNAVRGSHYPNDPVVLDYCDQEGLLFWEEIAFWNHPAKALGNQTLQKRARTMMQETMERDYNHPSVIIWGIQNESKSSSREGRKLFKKLAEDIRSRDSSRLISFASACGQKDLCFDFLDLICWNMYPGWYDDAGRLDDLDIRFGRRLKEIRKWLNQQGHDKPFYVTEFGAGAIPGQVTFDTGRIWTESYQAALLEKCIKALVNSKSVEGFYIWQYCDTRTSMNRRISLGRPRTFNNKGLVDEHRNPKLAFFKIQKLFRKIKSYPNQ